MSDIAAVISQLETQREAIQRALEALRGISGSSSLSSAKSTAPRGRPRKRRLSPEGRARIIAATKRRWAAHKAAQGKNAKAGMPNTGKRKRRKLSAEARKKMGDAARKRWAERRKAA